MLCWDVALSLCKSCLDSRNALGRSVVCLLVSHKNLAFSCEYNSILHPKLPPLIAIPCPWRVTCHINGLPKPIAWPKKDLCVLRLSYAWHVQKHSHTFVHNVPCSLVHHFYYQNVSSTRNFIWSKLIRYWHVSNFLNIMIIYCWTKEQGMVVGQSSAHMPSSHVLKWTTWMWRSFMGYQVLSKSPT